MIGWKPSEFRSGLYIHFEELVKPDKTMFIGTSNQDIEVIHRLADRYSFLHGHVVVNLQFVLRIVGGEEGKQARELFALAQIVHEFLIDFFKLMVVGIAVVLSSKRKEKPPAAPNPGTAGGSKNSR